MNSKDSFVVGRLREQAVLKDALSSNEAELISVIGRRRVGKTFLIRKVYEDQLSFEFAGVKGAPPKEQLQNFSIRLNRSPHAKQQFPVRENWLEAMYDLMDFLEGFSGEKKQVVFFDELPWLAGKRSGFLRAFDVFWNSWAAYRNIVVVICGSAASWMIQKVVNHKGGLHNRITKRLQLLPFNLFETTAFLEYREVFLDPYQITQIYMALGGIPHYLKEVKIGWSASRAIEEICFSPTGLLKNEFSRLYPALFDDAEPYITIIKALAGKQKGLTRNDLMKSAQLASGGTASLKLEELEQSGFISSYFSFAKKKKEKIYRLSDFYSLFYLRFIEEQQHEEIGVWQALMQTQLYKSWSGYAFENICLQHIPQIKKALGISGIYALSSAFFRKKTAETAGTQIDLVIDRNDHVINLVEAKFYNKELVPDQAFADGLRKKSDIFQETTATPKQLFWTVITTFGLQHNAHSLGLIQQTITLDDLFSPLPHI